MKIDINQVANQIKLIRQTHGMTMEEFGKQFNTSKNSVSNWENSRNLPNKARLKRIAEFADIPIEELLYGDGNFKISADKFIFSEFEPYYKKEREVLKNELMLIARSLGENLGILKSGETLDKDEMHRNFFDNFKEYAIKYINKNYKGYSYEKFLNDKPNSDLIDFQKFKENEWEKTKQIFDEIIENYKSTFTESNSVWINKRFTSQINNDLTAIKIKAIEEGKEKYYVDEIIQPILDEAAGKIKAINKGTQETK